MLNNYQKTLLLTLISLLLRSIAAVHQACVHTCGPNLTRVPYPFGFSPSCPIPLNCNPSTGHVTISEFPLQDLTAETILIKLPGKCNRSTESLRPLFAPHHAMTWRNSLMFMNCSTSVQGCLIPTSMVEGRIGSQGCDSNSTATSDNNNNGTTLSCYSKTASEYLSYRDLVGTGCGNVFSSVVSENESANGTVSMMFQVAELRWWVNGECDCVGDAECVKVVGPGGGGTGYRCQCREGFQGDGFVNGDGCRKGPGCGASRYMSGKCGGRARVGVLIGGIVAGAILMAIIALICCCIRKRTNSLKSQMSAKRLLWEAAGDSSIPIYPYKEIEKATNSFSDKQRLGNGAYGTVYAGKLHNNKWVAIKKIRHRDIDSVDQVMNEIKLLSSVSHPNLVRLLGCCIENGEQILVYEYMPNGTLSQHLQRERGNYCLPWTVRLTIAAETSKAIAYLHSSMNPPIYHRDIKSSNILLDYDFNSKVADFGLSRLGLTDDYSHISTAPQGTPGYVDPEYHQNFYLSDKSDVYSFGVVLVEMISALKVVDFSRSNSEVNLAALAIDRIGKGRLDEIVDPYVEPNRDAYTLTSIHKVAELAFRCLAFHRDMRPSMTEVAEELECIRRSGWAPEEDEVVSSLSPTCCDNGNEKSKSIVSGVSFKKSGVESRRLIVPQRADDCVIVPLEIMKDGSPVSVQDLWSSEQSSPSTNSLLSNAI